MLNSIIFCFLLFKIIFQKNDTFPLFLVFMGRILAIEGNDVSIVMKPWLTPEYDP